MVSSTWLYWRQGTLKCVLFMLFIAIFAPTLTGHFCNDFVLQFQEYQFLYKGFNFSALSFGEQISGE